MGIVFVDRATCLMVVKSMADNGLFAVYANNDRRVLQFLPPLITTEEQAGEILTLFEKSLNDLSSWKNRLMKKIVEHL